MKLHGLLAALALAVAPAAARAADALHPYSNIDHRVDAGNDTGDSRVEALKQAQLDRAAPHEPGWVPGLATIYPGRRLPPAEEAPGTYMPAYPYPPPAYGWAPPPYPVWY